MEIKYDDNDEYMVVEACADCQQTVIGGFGEFALLVVILLNANEQSKISPA